MNALLALAAFAAFAASPSQQRFDAANEACLRGGLDACIASYETLEKEGADGADFHYNLGTAYLKAGKIGRGVLHLERALRADPGDRDARANLERAERLRVDRLEGKAAELGGDERLLARVAERTNRDHWAIAFLVLWLVGFGALFARRALSSSLMRTTALVKGILLLCASLVAAGVVFAHFARARAREAIVLEPVVTVREGPSASLAQRFEVHEGLKVRVLAQDEGFSRVQLANGLTGWLDARSIETIDH